MIYYGTASGCTEEDEDDDLGERRHNSRLICYLDKGVRGAHYVDDGDAIVATCCVDEYLCSRWSSFWVMGAGWSRLCFD